jgi:hypothetical protein
MTPEGWTGEEVAVVRSAAEAMGWASFAWAVGFALLTLALTVVATRVVKRRAFWCSGAGRDVEVEFEDWGLLGFRRHDVLSCSAFEHPDEITCGRACLHAEGRVPLPFDAPYHIRRAWAVGTGGNQKGVRG